MEVEQWTIVVIVAMALCVLWRFTLGFALVILVQQVFRVIGLFTLAEAGRAEYTTAWLVLGSAVAFFIGYALTELVIRNRRPRDLVTIIPLPDSAVWSIVVVAGTLGVYHLIAGGIPLLSSDIETERFDFTSSGFFGIPGRMYLFGITIAWVVASANAQAAGIRWRSYRPWQWATFFMIFSAVLGGFKGDVFSLVLTVIAIFAIISGVRITFGIVLRKYWWTMIAAFAYFAIIAALYPSYATSGLPIWAQLYNRLTIVPSEPILFAVEGNAYYPLPLPMISDFQYFLARYSGQEIPGSYSFERAVSASIIGVDPASAAWTTPVTVSAFAELYVTFGAVVAYAVLAFAGGLLSFGESAPRRSVFGIVARAVTGVLLMSWLVKGGLAYHVFNIVAVSGILTLVAIIAVTVHHRSRPRRAGSVALTPQRSKEEPNHNYDRAHAQSGVSPRRLPGTRVRSR